ncbi:hypothetical protein ACIP3A_39440 [Streptomyces tricolor]|uniref:hypothetical protein n=1 Tax=Streptomyces tricolor TaxID=68277 RepID=UPI0038203A3D
MPPPTTEPHAYFFESPGCRRGSLLYLEVLVPALASAVPAYVLLAVLAVVVVLLAVVAIVARAVVAKARPQDLPHILPGLGQVLASLALFLPWALRQRGQAMAPPHPDRGGGRRQLRG